MKHKPQLAQDQLPYKLQRRNLLWITTHYKSYMRVRLGVWSRGCSEVWLEVDFKSGVESGVESEVVSEVVSGVRNVVKNGLNYPTKYQETISFGITTHYRKLE